MDWWVEHPGFLGFLLLILLAIFPRITLLCAMVFGNLVSGGILWWLGWFIWPNLLIAILAIPYWDSNPVLVIIAWVFAFAGGGSEGRTVNNRVRRRRNGSRT